MASLLLLGRREVEELLELEPLIDTLAAAMIDLSAGRASIPDRVAARVGEAGGRLMAMPGYVPSAGVLATKLVSQFPTNAGTGPPSHQALVVVFDCVDGRPLALLDGTGLTALRTAAGSALATRLLAREDAAQLAILGTGEQARAHALAVAPIREFSEVRIAGRSRERAEALAAALADELSPRVVAAQSYAEACAGAGVVCAATHSPEPVVRREWLAAGAHVNSVGFNPAGRELDDRIVAEALVLVESRDAALAPDPAGSNDVREPLERGLVSRERLTEVGELLSGSRPGRSSRAQITLYKSVGVAAQDCAAAAVALRAAPERGLGSRLEL